MHPSLHSSLLGVNSSRNSHVATPSSSNPLKRSRTPTRLEEESHRLSGTSTVADKDEGPGERRRRMLCADLFDRSERMLARLFKDHAASQMLESSHAPTFSSDPTSQTSHPNPSTLQTPAKRSTRTINEDDYGDDDEEVGEEHVDPSSPQIKDISFLPRPKNTAQDSCKPSSTPPKTSDYKSDDHQESAETVRKKLEAEKKAAEDAARESFQTMFYTLENDRDAMLEQQKLDELDREVETDISEQQKGAQGSTQDGTTRQGTLSSTNLGASSLALKHLIAKVDAKRNLVKATDTQLRVLMSEVRKNRSKWANEEKVGQEELYESAERVLMDLKSKTENSTPFLQKVNKREAPDYAAIIKNPMDIGTMIKKLRQLQYQSKKQFVDDLELIWSNCLKYNAVPSHPLRRKAEAMREMTRALTPLIPDLVIRDRADVEAEERRLHAEDDDADESDDEPLMSTRGRKAPGKTSKKGVTTARKAPVAGDMSSQTTPPEPKLASEMPETVSALANFKHEHLRSDAESIGEGSQRGITEPLAGDATPTAGSLAPPSQVDLSEMDGVETATNGVAGAPNEELEEEDEDYQTWKQVTKRDRAKVAAERHRLFITNRLNVEEPALLRTKGGMRRLLRLQNGKQKADDLLSGEIPELAGKPINQAATLAEGMDVDEDCVLPDYYEPLNNVPALDDWLLWAEDIDGQVIQRADFLRALPTEFFHPPTGTLASKMDSHMRQMQDTRKVVAKIGVVKQMQLQSQTYQNQFQKYDPPPLRDATIEATVVSDEDPVMPQSLCRAVLQRSIAKIFYHAGFEDFQPSAMDAITDLAGNYFADISSHLSLYHDAAMIKGSVPATMRRTAASGPSIPVNCMPRFTDEESVLHTLQAFSHDMNDLDTYVKEDLDRLTSRLELHHTRTKDYLAELLRPALDPSSVGVDGVGAFNDGSEQFVGGDFAEDLDEDFFGFRELGLDREFGFASLSVPLHLLQSRVHNAYQPASANATVGPGQVMQQPPSYPPMTLEFLNHQVNLVKDFFAKKLDANDDDPLIEDDDLPVKQRFPKPRLPPTGKISSPRKRPIREQQQLARKKRRLEIEAEREREREREAEAAGSKDIAANPHAPVTFCSVGEHQRVARPLVARDSEGDILMTDRETSHGQTNGMPEDNQKHTTSVFPNSSARLNIPEREASPVGDPQKQRSAQAKGSKIGTDRRDTNGHEGGSGHHEVDAEGDGEDDAEGDSEGGEDDGHMVPESLPIAAH